MRHEHARAAAHWSASAPSELKLRWWQSNHVVRHINRRVCGEAVPLQSAGAYRRLAELGPFRRGISIGCGEGRKELRLLQQGVVECFELYELASARVERGSELAKRMGLEGRATFHVAEGLEAAMGRYDLVHWNNALHHMLNVDSAVRQSRGMLAQRGVFFMDDYVGPNRLQWTPAMIEAATRFRSRLPDPLLRDPRNPGAALSREVRPPDLEGLMRSDPTEAADSENILPAVLRHFPSARVMLTGGVLYHTALNDVLHSLEERGEHRLLDEALAIDDAYADAGMTHYAVALARRD